MNISSDTVLLISNGNECFHSIESTSILIPRQLSLVFICTKSSIESGE